MHAGISFVCIYLFRLKESLDASSSQTAPVTLSKITGREYKADEVATAKVFHFSDGSSLAFLSDEGKRDIIPGAIY